MSTSVDEIRDEITRYRDQEQFTGHISQLDPLTVRLGNGSDVHASHRLAGVRPQVGDLVQVQFTGEAYIVLDKLVAADDLVTPTTIETVIGDGTVDTQHIVDAAITNLKVAFDAVDTANIVDAAVETAKIALAAVDTGQMADLAVETTKIANLAVTAAKIANLAVGTAQIDSLAVTNAKIDNAAVDTIQIAAAAITTALIDDLAVTDAKIASLVVNKLLGGQLQVAEYIESTGYVSNPEDPIVGFRIDGDGTAEFTSIAVGSQEYQIDEEGNASVASLSVTADDVLIGGRPYFGEAGSEDQAIRWDFPWGMHSWTSRDFDRTFDNVDGELPVVELHSTLIEGRLYRISTSELAFTAEGATSPTTSNPLRLTVRLRDGGSSSPSITSNLLTRASPANVIDTGPRRHTCNLSLVVECAAGTEAVDLLNPGEHRFLLTVDVTTPGDGSDAKIDTDSGLTNPIQLIVEDIGPAVPDTGIDHTGTGGGGGTTPVQNFSKTYSGTATKSFRGDGSVHSSTEGAQGDGSSSPNGNMSACFGFDWAQIQSDLSGATVTSCEVYLYYDHWHFIGGGTAVIGTHDVTSVSGLGSRPTTNMNEDRKRVSNWSRNEGKWVNLGLTIGDEFRTGTTLGIVIGRGPTSNDAYYGKTRGDSESYPPKVRIKYKK